MSTSIAEGNKIIAEFMGLYRSGSDHPFQQPNGIMIFGNGQYHSSWDWLMPVVEKIEATLNAHGFYEAIIFKRCCDIQTSKASEHLIEVTAANSKIEAVWQAVVQLLQLINTSLTPINKP